MKNNSIVASAAIEASTEKRWDCRDSCRDCSPFAIRESVFVSLALVRALTGSFTSTPSSDSDSQIRTRLSEGPTNTFPEYLRIASGSGGYLPLLLHRPHLINQCNSVHQSCREGAAAFLTSSKCLLTEE